MALKILTALAGAHSLTDGYFWGDRTLLPFVPLPGQGFRAPELELLHLSNAWREWPFMAADMGISQQTLMAHYLSNHVAVAYGDVFGEMVALSQELGFRVRVLGAR